MYRILQLLIIQRYATNDFTLLKPTATLLLLIKNYHSTNLSEAATFQNRMLTSYQKALAAIAEDCLSLRSKRVPQARQVLYEFDTVIRIIFGGAKTFLVRSLVTKNEHE